MGFMKTWEDERRKAVEKEKWQSGLAKAETEKDQALDLWIQLIDELQSDSSKGKKKSESMLEREKQVSSDLRSNMSSSLARKRKIESTGEGFSRKRAMSEGSSKDLPVRGNAKMMETILDSNERGDELMISKWSEIEKEKMDRYERIIDKSREQHEAEQQRKEEFDGLSKRVDRVLALLENGRER
ncbi:uncharacterized protein H6S33_001673 [Morchella sextelata]|uniref:uncharacterized protein n=1 Tax=Morchella sextelata TaxID=1174677 RepID=UPI001D053C74|nr:uncharacterized protein H6S33_001673 [Morchella sextelata]KAH0608539.1 hypothetical protein H6S33_001673 [Morchella sextelata]